MNNLTDIKYAQLQTCCMERSIRDTFSSNADSSRLRSFVDPAASSILNRLSQTLNLKLFTKLLSIIY